MEITLIREFVRGAIAAGGAVSIYCGYKLFCEIPYRRSRTTSVLNGLSGAVLALFGMGILSLDVQSIWRNPSSQSQQTVHHTTPAEAGSFTNPRMNGHRSTGDWAI